MNQLDDMLTVKDVATYMKRSYKTILKLIKNGKLPVTQDGFRGYRISKYDLFSFLGFYNESDSEESGKDVAV